MVFFLTCEEVEGIGGTPSSEDDEGGPSCDGDVGGGGCLSSEHDEGGRRFPS